jgi:hypothetical protein
LGNPGEPDDACRKPPLVDWPLLDWPLVVVVVLVLAFGNCGEGRFGVSWQPHRSDPDTIIAPTMIQGLDPMCILLIP